MYGTSTKRLFNTLEIIIGILIASCIIDMVAMLIVTVVFSIVHKTPLYALLALFIIPPMVMIYFLSKLSGLTAEAESEISSAPKYQPRINVGENDTIETIASQEKDSDRKDYSDEDKLLVLLGQGRISVAEYKRLTEKNKK